MTYTMDIGLCDMVSLWKVLVLFLFKYQGTNALQCASSTGTVSGPRLPYLPDSYQVSVECNMLDKGYTSTAKIYYDFPGNRATVKYFTNGIERSLIFSYVTDELFSVSNGYCTVSNLTASNITSLFGETYSNGVPHIQDSFKFGKKYGEVYIGNDTVRGIPVNHWQACTNFSQWSSMSIDYYFSANWTTASTFSSVPVRAEVRAQSTLSNGSAYLLHHIYDYFDFMPDVEMDDTVFQTPVGVICPGRKPVKSLPAIPSNFNYRVEKVFADVSAVDFEDVWYDSRLKYYRIDYKPLAPEEPQNTVNPTTEVHDYNTGVRYVMDKVTKKCSAVPLNNFTMDATQNLTASNINGSFMLNMRNPLQLLNLDSIYTFIGQMYTRNILCDVYVANRSDLYIDGFVSFTNLTITFYFMAQGWTDVADQLQESPENLQGMYGTPVQMDLLAVDTSLRMSYNFLDFNPEAPDVTVFDISLCYPEANKLTFKVTFPGTLDPNTGQVLPEWAHLVFAQTMGVSNIRISNVHMDTDDGNVYITATLLDTALPTAEFTYFPNKYAERQDSDVISNTYSPMECAQFCVDYPNIRCESFDFCTDHTCRLSTVPVSSGQILSNSTTCNHFARTVMPLPPEKNIVDAFSDLRLSVYNRTLQLNPQMDKTYTAVNVELVFGWFNPKVVVPTFPGQFSYKLQVTIPASRHVYTSSVWYDEGFSLIRYDPHYNMVMAPFYTTNPLTVIEDFNTGIRYVIDKVYQNCTVSRLTPDSLNTYLSPNTTSNATWILSMKDPYSSFYIDNTYKFVGQQTIRGMTCNLFESLRTDFRIPSYPHPVQSVLRYAFLSDQWSETSDKYLGSVGQPIRLDITVLDVSFYMQYNFYDFDTDHPDYSVYDIHQCNREGKWKHFTIQFPGPFNPYVETSSRMFMLEGLFRLANVTNSSILRFQRFRLDHDAVNIYLSGSLADKERASLYFTKIPVSYIPSTLDKVLKIALEDDCADACFDSSTLQCNSFYFCPQTSQCELSARHTPVGPGTIQAGGCQSYSRTVQDLGIPMSNNYAFMKLKNMIYTGNFKITIPIPGSDKTKEYTAGGITEEFTNTVTRSDEESALMEFNQLSDHAMFPPDPAHGPSADGGKTLGFIALDECALACTDRTSCNAFSYSISTQTCTMAWGFKDTDLNNTAKVMNTSTGNYLYIRKYSKTYTMNPGVTSQGLADSAVPSVSSDDDCGRLCSLKTGFTCRVFQYCANTQQCLLFKDRIIKPAQLPASGDASTCYQYSSSSIIDFHMVKSDQFIFTNILNIKMLSVVECADLCIQELGVSCTGFYYTTISLTCYLTGAMAGDGSGLVNSSTDPSAALYDVYKRVYFPPVSSKALNISTSIPAVKTSKGTPGNMMSPTSNSVASKVTCIPPSVSTVTVSAPAQASTANVHNTPSPQTGNNNTGVQTGFVVGIAFIMLLVGMVLGVIALHVYRHVRGKDEMKTNFVEHEEI